MTWLRKAKVVVPVDFSDDSFEAVDIALQLAETPAGVTVVHVLADLSPVEPGVVWGTTDKESRTAHVLEAIRQRLDDAKYGGIQLEVLFGDAGHEIAALAQREGAELIVLPSHGRTGIKRILIGSVAERVVRLAHCPVLVLRS
jgi:nucleotide-binding universal stress UspA family protein